MREESAKLQLARAETRAPPLLRRGSLPFPVCQWFGDAKDSCFESFHRRGGGFTPPPPQQPPSLSSSPPLSASPLSPSPTTQAKTLAKRKGPAPPDAAWDAWSKITLDY